MPGVDDDSVEVRFAQKLASNDKTSRDRALTKVGAWLKLRSTSAAESPHLELSCLELLKLWKGLFFCMWMSDKPLVQEQLAEDISQLVHKLTGADQHAQLFIDAGLTTLAREWNALDSLRRDKFLMLTRRLWRAWLVTVARRGWCEDAVSRLLDVCRSHITCQPASGRTPLSLQLHLIEIYPEELAKISGGHLSPALNLRLFAPFIELMQLCKDFRLVNGVVNHVFHYLMRQSDVGLDYQHPVNGPEEEENEEQIGESDDGTEGENVDADEMGALDPRAGGVHVEVPQLQLDYGQLSSKLLEAGAQTETRQKNRNRLYRLASQFNEVCDGEFPLRIRVPPELDSINSSLCQQPDCPLSTSPLPSVVQEDDSAHSSDAPSRINDEPTITDQQATNGERPLTVEIEKSADDTNDQQQKPKRRPKRSKKDLARVLVSAHIIDVEPEDPSMLNPQWSIVAPHCVEPGEHGGNESAAVSADGERCEERLADSGRDSGHTKTTRTRTKRRSGVVQSPKAAKLSVSPAAASSNNGHHTVEIGLNEGGDDEVRTSATPKRTDTELSVAAKRARKTKRSVSEQSSPQGDQQQECMAEEGVGGASRQKRRSWVGGDDWSLPGASEWDDDNSNNKTCNSDITSTVDQAVGGCIKGNGSISDSGRRAKRKLRNSGVTPIVNGGGAGGTPIVNGGGGGGVGTPVVNGGAPTVNGETPSIDKSETPTINSRSPSTINGGTPSAVNGTTPSTTNRRTPGRPHRSPKTPRLSEKKVNINLSKNTSQAFRDHLVTVRNSPQTPHNPDKVPSKGLLKARANTPARSAGTPNKVRRAGSTKKVRNTAADFF